MPPARVDLDVVVALQGVDRAVSSGDRSQPGLLLAEPELVAPVEAFAVRAVSVLEPEPAADVRDLGVGEVGDEPAKRIRRPGRVRVRERDDVAGRLADRPILGCDLPATRAVEQADARLAGGDRLDELVRPIGRGVGGDDDLEPVRAGSRARGGSRAGARSRPPRCTRRRSPRPTAPTTGPWRHDALEREQASPRRADSRRASRRARRASPRRALSPRPRGECSYARPR